MSSVSTLEILYIHCSKLKEYYLSQASMKKWFFFLCFRDNPHILQGLVLHPTLKPYRPFRIQCENMQLTNHDVTWTLAYSRAVVLADALELYMPKTHTFCVCVCVCLCVCVSVCLCVTGGEMLIIDEEMMNGRGCGSRVLERICQSKLIGAGCTNRRIHINVRESSLATRCFLTPLLHYF